MKFNVDIKIGFEISDEDMEQLLKEDNASVEIVKDGISKMFSDLINDSFDNSKELESYTLGVRVSN